MIFFLRAGLNFNLHVNLYDVIVCKGEIFKGFPGKINCILRNIDIDGN